MSLMRAAVVDGAGPPESFRIVNVQTPAPKDSEVLIRQTFAAVNFGDVIRRKRGMFSPTATPPYILGFEGVGTIERIGQSAIGFKIGDRVAYLAEQGGYGEYICVPTSQTWLVPVGLPDESAAGITCVGVTAWGLMEQSKIRPGDSAVVHGAAGGVGSLLVQLLSAHGVRVIALLTGSQKGAFVSGLGASMVVDRAVDKLGEEITGSFPAGVDVVFDCVGSAALEINLKLLKPGGTWMYYGSTSGHPDFPGNKILMNRLQIKGFVVFDFARDASAWREGTAFLGSAISRGFLKTQTFSVKPLVHVSEAHQLLEARSVMGKVVLRF